MDDTFQRSCEHWSEGARGEMEDFYALASVDYRYLATALDWKAWLEEQQARVGDRPMRLLDVACGAGKFPAALVHYAHVSAASVQLIDYGLLDPSAFSIREARRALTTPFVAGQEYETTLQSLQCPRRAFDIVWAIHALYAVPQAELTLALERFIHALDGSGFIAHACEDAHYLQFYRHYLEAFYDGHGVPYTSAEQIVSTLQHMGVACKALEIKYENGVPETQSQHVQGYLQRCVFDDSIGLDQMLAHPVTGRYLDSCRDNGAWHFNQRVMLIFIQS